MRRTTENAFAALLLAWAALGAAWIVQRTRGAGRIVAIVGGAAGALLLLTISASLLQRTRDESPMSGQERYSRFIVKSKREYGALSSSEAAAKTVPGKAGDAGGDEAAAADARSRAESYEGLPAQIEIPAGARQGWFTRELLATDAPRPVRVVMIATRVLSTLATAALLLFLAIVTAFRRSLAAGGAALLTRARLAKAPAAPAAP